MTDIVIVNGAQWCALSVEATSGTKLSTAFCMVRMVMLSGQRKECATGKQTKRFPSCLGALEPERDMLGAKEIIGE